MVENNLVVGVKLDKSSSIQSCDSCEYTKAHRKPFRGNRNYLVPRNLANKSILTCGDWHLSKPLTAENIMVPLWMI